jgi:hypothetical protein
MMMSAATPIKPLATSIRLNIAASPDRCVGTEKPVGLVPRIVLVRQHAPAKERVGTLIGFNRSMDQGC